MEPYLPREIIYRPKTGFGAPLRHWIRNELRPLVQDVLSPSTIERRGLFCSRAVVELVEADERGQIDAAYTIFALVCIEIWCRLFLDSTVPRRPH
jgi:asparagine synthase (glutamine-hydrolysing)